VFILDSDVLTIVDGSRRNSNVSKWFDSLNETDIFISVITIFEKSKNATHLAKKGNATDAAKAEATLNSLKTVFADRIISLDATAAEDWGRMMGKQDKHPWDTAVAAIAKQAKFHIASRNAKHFVFRGATVTDPFHNPARVLTA
jgi:predicted nucleic acid-binding protein